MDRFDEFPSGRHLVDHTHIQISVCRHGQGPWNRRCGHDKHVRWWIGLGPQLAPLGNPKSVLLINNRKPQIFENHFGFDECMGPNENVHFTRLQPF